MATNFDDTIELFTGTNSTTFTDADKLILANYIYRELCAEVNEVDPTRFNRTAYADFTPDTDSNADGADHSLPLTSGVSDLVAGQVDAIWVRYSASTNWYLVTFYPKSDIDFNRTYSEVNPIGWWEGNNFKILPQPSAVVTDGLKINFSNRATDLTTITTDPVALDKEFWELIPIGVAYKKLQADGDYELSERYKQEYESGKLKMKRKIDSRGGNKAMVMTFGENYSEEYK
jgi:hypothetical protein